MPIGSVCKPAASSLSGASCSVPGNRAACHGSSAIAMGRDTEAGSSSCPGMSGAAAAMSPSPVHAAHEPRGPQA
jgi:hypothetical protein